MASQNTEQGPPIRAIPITSAPPKPNPAKEASSSNPQTKAAEKKKMPPKPRYTPSEYFKSKESFIHANTSSTVSEIELRKLRERCHIPDTHAIRVPRSEEKMYQRPEGWTAVQVTILEKGVRFPLHPFLSTILGFIGVGFAQLVPNSYIHVLAFIAFCYEAGVEPSLDFFFSVYKIGQSRERGFKVISKQASRTGEKFERRSLVNTPSSNRGWHEKWFYVKGPEVSSLPNWATDEKISTDFGDISDEREAEMVGLFDNFPKEEWRFGLLSKQAWLYDHKLTLIKPSTSEVKELEDFLAGKSPEVPAESSQQETLPEEGMVGKFAGTSAGFSQPEASSKLDPPAEKPSTGAPPTNVESQTIERLIAEPVLPEIPLRPRRRKHAARKLKRISVPSDSEGFSESESRADPIPPPITEPVAPMVNSPPPNIDSTPPTADPIPPVVEPATIRRSLLDLPAGDRRQAIRIKKLKTQVTPLTAEDLRVPSSSVIPPINPVGSRTVNEGEQAGTAATPSRKRKRSTDYHPSSSSVRSPIPDSAPAQSSSTENVYMDPSPIRGQPAPPPPGPSSRTFHDEATGMPTLWPRYNSNFPFQLFDAFVRENDDHRFVDHTNGNFLDEGMSYLAKANAVFGRLRPRQLNSESDEESLKREVHMLKASLDREREENDAISQTNESLQMDLAQAKGDLRDTYGVLTSTREELKTSKSSEQKLADLNVRFVAENEALKNKNEEVIAAHQDLAKQFDELKAKAKDDRRMHKAKCRELRNENQALRERDPPLTEEVRKQIQEDYRTSDELGAEIMKVYYEGFEDCRGQGKEKLVAAQLDPALLDFENDV